MLILARMVLHPFLCNMNIEEIRDYCLAKKDVAEGFPFGEETLVFKVNDKIFLLAALTRSPLQFNVKCDPARAIQLREDHDAIIPGYHMNKKHWNTVICDNTLNKKLILEMIDHSYELVAGTKTKRKNIGKA